MTKVAAILSLVLTLLLGADATLAQKTIETGDFSGWMDNYEMLTFDEQRNAFIFENEVKQGVYKKVMFDSLVFQGEGLVTNPKIAGEANQYLEQGIRDILQRNGIGATASRNGAICFGRLEGSGTKLSW